MLINYNISICTIVFDWMKTINFVESLDSSTQYDWFVDEEEEKNALNSRTRKLREKDPIFITTDFIVMLMNCYRHEWKKENQSANAQLKYEQKRQKHREAPTNLLLFYGQTKYIYHLIISTMFEYVRLVGRTCVNNIFLFECCCCFFCQFKIVFFILTKVISDFALEIHSKVGTNQF